jgi:5-methylcytosine-specific restriction endonuclease McrA
MSKPCGKCGGTVRDKRGYCTPCRREYHRAYNRQNRAELNARRRERYAQDPEFQNRQRLWNQAYGLKKRNGGDLTSKQIEAIYKKYDYKCLCCGRDDVELSIDHVNPKKPISIENAQPLCRSCNTTKYDREIDYRPDSNQKRWRQSRLI